ncbi:MAG: protein-L-isoaspartate(D-aspartate) O-methyltransferase [candidate division WOR-3 bacterium]|nr:protein-L-isoaspartate(D-aspartate) O-methyltransferase [candidate division WOR-3 bacterium]
MQVLVRTNIFATVLIFIILSVIDCAAKSNKKEVSWDVLARKDMVYNQIKGRGIKDDRLVNAMLEVERHKFVPESLEKLAYGDYPLPIGEDQTISQPYVVALMTDELQLKATDRVLEIGTGSGYQAAILSLMVKDVFTIEIIASLADSAARRLASLGYRNVHVRHGDGFLGWPEEAPFDAIIITCAPSELPEPLVLQLAEGGRLILPLGDDFQMLTLYRKMAGALEKREIIPVRFVPMKGLIEEQ